MNFFKNTGNILILGFVLAALSMIFLAYKATTVHFDLAVKGDYYQEETKFNDLLIAKANADKMNSHFALIQNGDNLTIKIPPALSETLENGSIEFYCISNSEKDSKQQISPNKSGIYLFKRSIVAEGKNYIVKVSFVSKNKEYYKEFRM